MEELRERNNLIYVCSPLNAPTQEGIESNMKKAAHYCEVLEKIIPGSRCIAPHSFIPAYLNDNNPAEREIGLQFGISVLKISSAIIVCGNVVSRGMAAEIKLAAELGIPTYFYHEVGQLSVLTDSEGHEVWQVFQKIAI